MMEEFVKSIHHNLCTPHIVPSNHESDERRVIKMIILKKTRQHHTWVSWDDERRTSWWSSPHVLWCRKKRDVMRRKISLWKYTTSSRSRSSKIYCGLPQFSDVIIMITGGERGNFFQITKEQEEKEQQQTDIIRVFLLFYFWFSTLTWLLIFQQEKGIITMFY